MKIAYIESVLSLVLSLAGNISLGGLFLAALLFPSQYGGFIFRTGMLIFLVEFLSIHSSGMAFGIRQRELKRGGDTKTRFFISVKGLGSKFLQRNPKFTMMGLYSLFIITFALTFQNWFIPLYFFVSLISKFFGARAIPDRIRVGMPPLLFIGILFLVLPLSGFLPRFFPVPPEILSQRLPNSSGLLVDRPQALLLWGVLYFFSISLVEIILFLRGVHAVSRPVDITTNKTL